MTAIGTREDGLTLVEAAIIVAILGLLAALAVPRMLGGTPAESPPQADREQQLLGTLAELRGAIDAYWAQHEGFPGSDGAAQLERQLCHPTDARGEVSSPSASLGPYLAQGRLPVNPFTGTRSVRICSPLPGDPTGTEAWVYDPVMGEIRANVSGPSSTGTPLYDL